MSSKSEQVRESVQAGGTGHDLCERMGGRFQVLLKTGPGFEALLCFAERALVRLGVFAVRTLWVEVWPGGVARIRLDNSTSLCQGLLLSVLVLAILEPLQLHRLLVCRSLGRRGVWEKQGLVGRPVTVVAIEVVIPVSGQKVRNLATTVAELGVRQSGEV